MANEPMPADDPLWTAPNVLITPHNACDTDTSVTDFADIFLNVFEKWISGDEVPNQVSKTLGY